MHPLTHTDTHKRHIHSIALFDVWFLLVFSLCNYFAFVCDTAFSNITFELHLERLFGMVWRATHTPNVDFICANDDLLECSWSGRTNTLGVCALCVLCMFVCVQKKFKMHEIKARLSYDSTSKLFMQFFSPSSNTFCIAESIRFSWNHKILFHSVINIEWCIYFGAVKFIKNALKSICILISNDVFHSILVGKRSLSIFNDNWYLSNEWFSICNIFTHRIKPDEIIYELGVCMFTNLICKKASFNIIIFDHVTRYVYLNGICITWKFPLSSIEIDIDYRCVATIMRLNGKCSRVCVWLKYTHFHMGYASNEIQLNDFQTESAVKNLWVFG